VDNATIDVSKEIEENVKRNKKVFYETEIAVCRDRSSWKCLENQRTDAGALRLVEYWKELDRYVLSCWQDHGLGCNLGSIGFLHVQVPLQCQKVLSL
jgi:hypothetical protein